LTILYNNFLYSYFLEKLNIFFSFIYRQWFSFLPVILLTLLFISLPNCAWAQNQVNDFDYIRSSQSEEELEPVTVQAPRPDWERELSPGTVSVIITDELRSEHKDLAEMLMRLPGVHVSKRGDGQYTTASIRGSSSAQVNVYVDGVLQNLGISGTVDLSLIPVNNVERIEVYRGYIPVRFTGAPIGGVINIVTKKPEALGGRAAVGASSYGGYDGEALVNFPLLGGTGLISAHYEQADNDFEYIRTIVTNANLPKKRTRLTNGFKNQDFLAKWQNDIIYVRATAKKMDRDIPQSTSPNSGGSQYTDYKPCLGAYPGAPGCQTAENLMTNHRHQIQEQFELIIGGRYTYKIVEMGLEFEYTKQKNDYENKNITNHMGRRPTYTIGYGPFSAWSVYNTEKYVLVLDGSIKLGPYNLLEFRTSIENERTTTDGNDLAEITKQRNYVQSYNQKRSFLQIQDTFTLSDTLWLTGILRNEDIKTNVTRFLGNVNFPADKSSALTWGLAVKKDIGEQWTFSASYGTFRRYPTMFELYGDGANVVPALVIQTGAARNMMVKSEYGDQWDASLQWRGNLMDATVKLELTYFSRYTYDHIIYRIDGLSGRLFTLNGNNIWARGIEFEALLNWRKFDLFISGTKFNSNADSNSNWHRYDWNNPPLYAQWELFIRGDYRLLNDSLSLYIEHHYLSESNWFGTASGFTHSPDRKTNVGFKLKLPYNFTVAGGIDDVFNNGPERYCTFCSSNEYSHVKVNLPFPEPGRTWHASVEYEF
jgi:outer membrane receptor protein involved in Fe transport